MTQLCQTQTQQRMAAAAEIYGDLAVGILAVETLCADPKSKPSTRPTEVHGPSTQHLRTLVPKTIKGIVFGSRNLEYWVIGPSGTSLNHYQYHVELCFRYLIR